MPHITNALIMLRGNKHPAIKPRLRRYLMGVLLLSLPLLNACDRQEELSWSGGDLRGVNHTAVAINRFSVNGSGGPNISPFGEGGGMCCISLPNQWQPGLQAHVEWEVDPDPYERIPFKKEGYEFEEKAWALHKSKYQKHAATVGIPKYGKDRCGLTVHFLPCNQIKVTTSCTSYGAASYPIKDPRRMEEPEICPK